MRHTVDTVMAHRCRANNQRAFFLFLHQQHVFSYPISINCISISSTPLHSLTNEVKRSSTSSTTFPYNGLHNTNPSSPGPPDKHTPLQCQRQRRQDRLEERGSLINGVSQTDAAGEVGERREVCSPRSELKYYYLDANTA